MTDTPGDAALRFRKKPVVIEAYLLTRELVERCLFDGEPWPDALHFSGSFHPGRRSIDGGGVMVKTLEGYLSASIGDWIIKGIKGEFYPCKPDIFEATYEPADTRHTPGDAALREDVRQLAEMVAAHSESDMCAECRKQARIVLRLLMEHEANTRHTPEGGAVPVRTQCRFCGHDVTWPGAVLPKPQSGAPDAQLVRTEAGRRVDAPDAAESSSGERLGRANDSASGVAPRPQTPGGAPDAPPVVAHCGWCPRVGIKQGLEEYCPGIAPAPPALSAEEREALREALRQEFSHKAMDTIAALLARTEAK